jgi:radical SAM superfamily enzyme YgiQ (UPF0313 family)
MRVLLVDPVAGAGTVPVEERRALRAGLAYPGLGLYEIAALTPPSVDLRVVDEAVEDVPDDFAPDVVGISVEASTSPRAYALAERFRAARTTVVLGGVHVTLNPEEARRHADAIVVGEAQPTWPRLLEDFGRGGLQGTYRVPGLADLDAAPAPRRDLVAAPQRHPPWVVLASRGCPFGCEFCALAACTRRAVRFREPAAVAEEIRGLPAGPVLFVDDNIYASAEAATRLFRALRPLRRRWVAESTWHIAFDREALLLARDSGCLGLFVGFDSINRQPGVAKVPGDGAEEKYIEAIGRIVASGIACDAAFVFGFDGDDESVFERTLRVVREGGANLTCFNVLVPYPGTPLFRRLEREGRITERDWSRYASPNVCFRPRRMSASRLYEGTLQAQKEWLSLPNVARTAALTTLRLGWARGLLALKMNLAQRRNWPFGTFGTTQERGEAADAGGD